MLCTIRKQTRASRHANKSTNTVYKVTTGVKIERRSNAYPFVNLETSLGAMSKSLPQIRSEKHNIYHSGEWCQAQAFSKICHWSAFFW